MSNSTIAQRFAEQAGRPDARLLLARSGNVYVNPYDHRELLSWGSHFVTARIMLDSQGERSWWLLNGDRYSVSTSRHQADIRSAAAATGLPVIILPFTALREARIELNSITPHEILKDEYVTTIHTVATRNDIPEGYSWSRRELPDGRWAYETGEHRLGASVFSASYVEYENGRNYGPHTLRRAHFLSAFDEQERNPLYFLAQLPGKAKTVTAALESLKPRVVKAAEAAELPVVRQGDVFGVPTELATRELTARAPIQKRARVLGVNHTVSEVAIIGRVTYGRGVLRHEPGPWREPEHKRQKMGDGRTWHLLVKNTVPPDRSWSMGGNVD
jgi:hypothetical protein